MGESKQQDLFITVMNGLNLTISHFELNIRRTKAMYENQNNYMEGSGTATIK